MDYYSHLNLDLLQRLPRGLNRVLEVGCGRGRLARAYLESNGASSYFGVEINKEAAAEAAGYMTAVVAGNIEHPAVLARLDAILEGEPLDALVFGDVLEHLINPWQVLKALVERAGDGAVCLACLPNVCHWSIIAQLMGGDWKYASSGLLDITHLRFFTLKTARALLERSGLRVVEVYPLVQGLTENQRTLVTSLLEFSQSLGREREAMKADLMAYQWIVKGVKM